MNRVLSSLMALLATVASMTAGPVPNPPEVPEKSVPKVSKSEVPGNSVPKVSKSVVPGNSVPRVSKPEALGNPAPKPSKSEVPGNPVPKVSKPEVPGNPIPKLSKSVLPVSPFSKVSRPEVTGNPVPKVSKSEAPGNPVPKVSKSEVPGKSVPKVSTSTKLSRKKPPKPPYQIGIASWYGKQFHGRSTASGEDFDMFDLTAAHRELPLGTYVKVTNLRNGKSIVVLINDRGPYIDGRILDLSYGAARMLYFSSGLEMVRIDVLGPQTVTVAQNY